MKSIFISSLVIPAVFAATESLSTIQSTIVSSVSCSSQSSVELVPSKFVYSNASSVSSFAPLSTTYSVVDVSSAATAALQHAVAANSTEARSTIYDYDVATNDNVFQATRTICHGSGNCYVTTDLESSTTYTTTVDGILTVITTQVPVSASTTGAENNAITESASASMTVSNVVSSTSTPAVTSAPEDSASTKTQESTTVVTITSCQDKKCSKVARTTGLTVVTVTSDEMVTQYTTFCPLSGKEESTSKVETPVSSQVPSPQFESTEIPETPSTQIPEAPATQIPEAPATQIPEAPATQIPETPATQIPPPQIESTETPIAPKSNVPLSTINVITNNIVTETPASSTMAQQSSNSQQTHSVFSTYEGGAATFAGSTTVVGLLVSFVLMLI